MKATFSLKHVSRITDHIGIIEHCIFATPNRKEGYCVDDNARALLACLRIDGKEKKTAQQLIPIYLRFLVRALDKKGFHQNLNQGLTWEDDAGVEDGFGRAMVALGETTLSALQGNQKLTAAFIFDQQAFLIPT
ncbi:MAG: glycosyl transferase, partial [Patescibacteria group bacterium]